MTVRVLGLNFSIRDNSNSRIMLEQSFDRLLATYPGEAETEIIDLRKAHIQNCIACDVCGKSLEDGHYIPCVQADEDDVQIILDKMVEADGMCIATPVYFGMPSDLFSKFIMRTRILRHQDFKLANRPVGVMAIAARRSGGAETTILTAWLPFVRNGCLVVGNGDGTSQYGAYGWAGKRGHIESDEWGLDQGFQTAERVFTIAKLIKAGAMALSFKNRMKFSYSQGTRL